MGKKRTVVLIDDLFSSNEDFWESHDDGRGAFEKDYELSVFQYGPDSPFALEWPRICSFLRSVSGTAQVLLLDLMFPDAPRGGIEILQFVQREGIDIPAVIMCSSSEDQGLAVELAGFPFVHRHHTLDLEALSVRLNELFAAESMDHPERGILITHGTDTLSYVVEFLRYGVRDPSQRLSTNIVVTGSQIPMGREGAASDAVDNVRSAVLLLQHLYAPQIGVVFNRGEQFFRSNIQKVSKWHPAAFHGSCDVDLDWDQFRSNNQSVRLRGAPPPLRELVLLRTGGTIESVHVEGRGYTPGGDFVSSFITGNLANNYERFSSIPFTSLDSSNMTVPDWISLLDLLRDDLGVVVDTDFEPRIGLVMPSPFLTVDDYRAWIGRFEGIVIAGYGAGNANILAESSYSLLRAIGDYAKKKPVVLASQVPYELTDFAYEVGRMFIEAGCIPAGNLAFPACQVRLSYLLGHRDSLALKDVGAVRELFVHGLSFRTDNSLHVCEEILTKARRGETPEPQRGGPAFAIRRSDPLVARAGGSRLED